MTNSRQAVMKDSRGIPLVSAAAALKIEIVEGLGQLDLDENNPEDFRELYAEYVREFE